MHLPILQPGKSMIQSIDRFGGYNHNLRIRPGEFYDMENLTSDLSPVLSVRKPRGILKQPGDVQALACKEGLCYVEGPSLYINGKKLDLHLSQNPKDCPKQLISMGAYLIILPDRKYVNTVDPSDKGNIDCKITTSGPVSLIQCTLEGKEIRPEYAGKDTPKDPGDKSYWLDYESRSLKQYEKAADLWVEVASPYVKLQYPGLGQGFSQFDGVELSGDPALQDLAGSVILHSCGEDYVIFPGLIRENCTLTKPVTLERAMPRMDFCIESGNRLWGCRYGPNRRGNVVNEIYCSKLGDFKNWSCYLGISTDSYTVSLGSDGPFTGAVTYGGYPIFFKEQWVHKVFGQMPSNFSVQSTACRGVQQGSSRSLAIVREVLYYLSNQGVCAYDGSMPREVSEALGKRNFSSGVAAGCQGKYYISMEEKGSWNLFVLDTEKGVWHREDGLQAKFLCPRGEDLICADQAGRFLSLTGKNGTKEEAPVSWMAETGIIGVNLPGNKYLGKMSLRMLLDPGSQVTVLVQYDSQGQWESLGTIQGMHLKSFTFPVLPRRCDHLRLKLQGKGPGMLFSAAKVIKPGSL